MYFIILLLIALYITTQFELQLFSRSMQLRSPHPSVTDPAEPDPVDYSPLPSENLASPVPSEYFDFTQLYLCFPSDCAVRIENPSVFLKTNKPTKKKVIKIKQ